MRFGSLDEALVFAGGEFRGPFEDAMITGLYACRIVALVVPVHSFVLTLIWRAGVASWMARAICGISVQDL